MSNKFCSNPKYFNNAEHLSEMEIEVYAMAHILEECLAVEYGSTYTEFKLHIYVRKIVWAAYVKVRRSMEGKGKLLPN